METSSTTEGPTGQLPRLLTILRRLRGPGGCQWDAAQTHQSLLSHLIEECYEVVDAVQEGHPEHLAEELGDLLLQVVFHAEIGREAGRFDLETIAAGLCEKLIRRHPHVFGEAHCEDVDSVLSQWDELKRQERGESLDLPYLHRVGTGLPSLLAAYKIQKKAAKVGFDWPESSGALQKVHEEITEVQQALAEDAPPEALKEELGDLLFSVVNLTRKLGGDPEQILHQANQKFVRRFGEMEDRGKAKALSLKEASLHELEALWQETKDSERGESED